MGKKWVLNPDTGKMDRTADLTGYATEDYVNSHMSGGVKSWFFTKEASDIGGMYKATTTLPTGSIQTITGTAVKNTETTIAEFLTELQTTEYRVTDGSRFFYVTGRTDNDHLDVTLKGYIYLTDINGDNPTLLRTSNISDPLIETDVQVTMNAWGGSLVIPTTTRVKFVITAINSHNSDHDVTISVEDDTFSRLDVPSPVGVTDISGLVPYTGATTDVDLGAHSVTASNLSGTNTGDSSGHDGLVAKTDTKTIKIDGDFYAQYLVSAVKKISPPDLGYGYTITRVVVQAATASPTTQFKGDLKWCDAQGTGAFPSTNPTVIKVMDTTTGNYDSGAITENVATGKELYIQMDSNVDYGVMWTITIMYTLKTS